MSLLSDLINLNDSDVSGKIIAEYVWFGGSGLELRSKARTQSGPVSAPSSKLPKWNYDGPSTGQAPAEDSEVLIYPQAIYPGPFRRGNHIRTVSDSVTDQSKLNYEELNSDQAAREVSRVIIKGQDNRSKRNGHARRKRSKKKRKHNKSWSKK